MARTTELLWKPVPLTVSVKAGTASAVEIGAAYDGGLRLVIIGPAGVTVKVTSFDGPPALTTCTLAVRGVGSEYFSFGTNPVYSLERHQEAHDLIVRAWTEPGPFAFEGKHYHCEYVNVWPRPFQQPHPPIWCPSMGSVETLEWADGVVHDGWRLAESLQAASAA